jgi:hypothetical protein
MNYHVHWTPAAHDLLERIWMSAADPRLVLRAANAIDHTLSEDPWSSDVVLGDEKTLIVEPLAVDFEVDELRRRVLILHVWTIGFLEDRNA